MGSPWSIPPPKARRAATSCSWRAFAPGLVVAIIISQIDYEFIAALWPVWGVIALVLVALTYTGLGLNVGGTDDTAWLGITVGSLQLTFQPSELLKIVFIITFSKHLSMVREHINEFKTFLLVALHGLVPIGLIFKQGDDGTMLVFVFMVVSMMFAAGVKPVYFLGGATLVGAVIPFLWDRLIADKLDRFLCLIYVDDYIMETGWQQYLGLRALGSGQLWGRGFMEGGGTACTPGTTTSSSPWPERNSASSAPWPSSSSLPSSCGSSGAAPSPPGIAWGCSCASA